MYHDVDLVEPDTEQLVRLDDFETFVHERRLSIVILAPMFHVGCASASADATCSSSAAVRPRNGPPLAVRMMRRTSDGAAAAQALPDRRVLGVDGHDLAAAGGARLGDDRARRDQAFLVREREALARVRARPSVAGKPAKPTTAFRTTSASGCAASSPSTSGSSAHARTQLGGHAELGRLLREQLGVAPGREGDDAVLVAVPAKHVERLRPDRAGRTEDDHSARHVARGYGARPHGRIADSADAQPIFRCSAR